MKVTGGSVDLPSSQLVDLGGPAPEIVLHGLTTPLTGGETVQLVLIFATAGSVTLGVPVEPHAYDYATFSPPPTPTPTATARPKATGSASPGASASASAQPVGHAVTRRGAGTTSRSAEKSFNLPNGPGVPVSGS